MFAYRHRQLAADLAAHARAREVCPEPLTVALTGASGLIGSSLAALLTTGGHRVIRLVRRAPQQADEREWRPDAPDSGLLAGVDAVVHLAGAPIGRRFTEENKREILASRTGPTRALALLAAMSPGGPRTFVTASAVGFYGADRGDEILTENSERGDGFLADVAAAWEDATAPATAAGIRTVQVRTGIVQTPRGGMLRLLYPLFEAGLGGPLGDGTGWQPWIEIDDLESARAVSNRTLNRNQMRRSEFRWIGRRPTQVASCCKPAFTPTTAPQAGQLGGSECNGDFSQLETIP